MNALLDAGYGTTAAAHCPVTHDLALFYGDPRDLGVEITGGGYDRVAIAAADWSAAADGEKSTALMTFPDTTDEWSSEATHWALYDGTDLWDSGPLTAPLEVTGAGAGPKVRVIVRFADSILPDED